MPPPFDLFWITLFLAAGRQVGSQVPRERKIFARERDISSRGFSRLPGRAKRQFECRVNNRRHWTRFFTVGDTSVLCWQELSILFTSQEDEVNKRCKKGLLLITFLENFLLMHQFVFLQWKRVRTDIRNLRREKGHHWQIHSKKLSGTVSFKYYQYLLM